MDGEAAEKAYVERIGAGLPGGIRLAYDGRYAAMLSLKIKNYVLVDYDGRKTFRGARSARAPTSASGGSSWPARWTR